MNHAGALPPRWIVSRSFDLTLFFGGAALSLLVLGLFALGAPIVALWWIWLLAFDGPHIGAAFTRTYFDRQEWIRRPGTLAGSLLTFLVGPLFLAAGLITGSPDPFLWFLGLATFYGYYHVVRQHYGFVALYNAANRESNPRTVALDRWTLYLGSWLPYAYFLVAHPRARVLIGLTPGDAVAIATVLLPSLWVLTLLYYAWSNLLRHTLAQPKVAYLLTTVILHGAIYFVVSRFEPVYGASTGPDQDFLLLSILIVIFHNVQYLGLVWFHNRNRYGHYSPGFFIGVCAIFSLVIYLTFACSTGVFPGCAPFTDRRLGPVSWNQIGLCLWWGLAINHYFLDQKIWRLRGDPELKKNLRLA